MTTDKPGTVEFDLTRCGVCGSPGHLTCGLDIQFLSHPEPCGYMKIADGYKVALNKYPNWFHRLMVRLILGWRFERVEKEKR